MPNTDQGNDFHRYLIIPRTLIFLFNHRNQVLLLRGAENKRLWAGLLNGIGGHVEVGEDIFESAERELWEETGIAKIPLLFCGQIMIDVGSQTGVGVFLFRGRYDGSDFNASREGALEWVDLDNLINLPLVEDLPLLIPKIAAFTLGAQPLIGKYSYNPDGSLRILFR